MTQSFVSVLAQADHAAQADPATPEEFVVGEMQYDGEVTEATIIPSGALTADDTNTRTFVLQNRGGDANESKVIATLVTNTAGGDWVAGDEKKMVLASATADRQVISNDVLMIVESINGAGAAHPNFEVTVKGQRR